MDSDSPTEYPSLPRYWLRDVLFSHRFYGSVMSIKLKRIVRSFWVLLFQVSMDSSRWVKVLVCFGICPESYRAKQKQGRGQP